MCLRIRCATCAQESSVWLLIEVEIRIIPYLAPNFDSKKKEMSTAARAAKEAKRIQKMDEKEKRARVLLQNQLNVVKEELNSLKKSLIDSPKIENQPTLINHVVIQDLIDHLNGSKDDFTNETYNLAMQIKAISPKAYAILASNMRFPTLSRVDMKFKAAIADIPQKLTDTECIGELVNMWKEKHGISKSENIDACLAVDALYFKPDFKISENDCISGAAFNEDIKGSLPEGSFSHFDNSPSALQAFLELNWDRIVKAGFVFQIQPYNVRYKPFVVHIKPSPNGKASDEIVELLYKIRDVVKNRRITIKSFAFDGDNAYKQLHVMYFESYIHKVLESNRVSESNTKVLRIVSDYLHLLKRLRYRLLSSILHAGFNESSGKIIIEELQSILDGMGDVVWCNESYTKMHDKLPLELFKTENLLKLIKEKHFVAAAYWFPITLSNIAINEKDIGFEYRDFLLKCAFYFLVYYYQIWDKSEDKMRQRKRGENRDVTFYTKEMLIEFTNTLHAHIQLMHNVENYTFSRNSSTPLEHKFAFGRAKSRDVNTLTRFIQVISSIQGIETERTFREICSFNEEADKIRGRNLGTGITVEPKGEDSSPYAIETEDEDDLPFTPQTVAKAFLIFAGFDTPKTWIIDYENAICWTEFFLSQFIENEPEKRKKRRFLTLNSYRYDVDTCQRAKSLITGKAVKAPLTTHQNAKREYKMQLFDRMCRERLGSQPSKENLIEVIDLIKEVDPNCPKPPTRSQSKSKIYEWIIDNLQTYFVYLDQY